MGSRIYQLKRNQVILVGLVGVCSIFLIMAFQTVIYDFQHLIPIIYWAQPWIAIFQTPVFMFDLLMFGFWGLILPMSLISNLQPREIRTAGIVDPIIVWNWQDIDSFRFNPENGDLEFKMAYKIFGWVKPRTIKWKVPVNQHEKLTAILSNYLPFR